jgi:hypothetical protein
MRWLEVHRHWLTKIGGGPAGPVTGGEAVAVRGRFPDNPGQEQIRQFAGMAPSSCEQVAATALLASADSRRGIPASVHHLGAASKDAAAGEDRVRT